MKPVEHDGGPLEMPPNGVEVSRPQVHAHRLDPAALRFAPTTKNPYSPRARRPVRSPRAASDRKTPSRTDGTCESRSRQFPSVLLYVPVAKLHEAPATCGRSRKPRSCRAPRGGRRHVQRASASIRTAQPRNARSEACADARSFVQFVEHRLPRSASLRSPQRLAPCFLMLRAFGQPGGYDTAGPGKDSELLTESNQAIVYATMPCLVLHLVQPERKEA
jgi:hypothetical protein